MIGMFNKYNDDILRHIEQDHKKELMKQIALIDISNAAQWFLQESEQEYWDWEEDFPSIISPWPRAWYEYKTPKYTASKEMGVTDMHPGKFPYYGALVETLEIPKELREDALKYDVLAARTEMQAHILGRQDYTTSPEYQERMAESRQAAIEHHENGRRAKWICDIALFVVVRRRARYVLRTAFYIDTMGRYIHTRTLMGFGPDMPQEFRANLKDHEGFLRGAGGTFLPILFSISLMHCKNVVLINAPAPPRKVQKARAKRGKPTIKYKQLVVEPLRQQVRYEQNEDDENTDQIKRALHICRGHFKDYRDGKGLFGKYQDVYWWDMQVRGDRDIGEVKKSYKVVAKEQQPSRQV